MRREYKLYWVLAGVCAVLVGNAFIRVLNDWWMLAVVGGALAASLGFFGFVKEKSHLLFTVRVKVLLWAGSAAAAQFLVGLSVGFLENRTPKLNAVSLLALIFLSEILRYILCFKAKTLLQTVLVGAMFLLVDIAFPILYFDASSLDAFVEFSTINIFPSVSKNFLLTYMSKMFGYSPCILYRLLTEMFRILMPLLPDFGDFVNSAIAIVLPALLVFNLYRTLHPRTKRIIHTEPKSNGSKVGKAIGVAIMMVAVYFTSGVFRFHALTIVSGSMEPTIRIGDMVIVDQYYKDHVDEVKLGDVLVFNKHGVAISHRVVKIDEQDKNRSFYTKGDNNAEVDNWVVKPDEVIGVSKISVPAIGYPVLLWNKLIGGG